MKPKIFKLMISDVWSDRDSAIRQPYFEDRKYIQLTFAFMIPHLYTDNKNKVTDNAV
jgi:hypothetical protein